MQVRVNLQKKKSYKGFSGERNFLKSNLNQLNSLYQVFIPGFTLIQIRRYHRISQIFSHVSFILFFRKLTCISQFSWYTPPGLLSTR